MEEKVIENFEVVFVLDRSGSMCGKEEDTIGGFNSLLAKQKGLPGNVKVSTVLFDDEVEVLHDRLDINIVKNITHKEYFVRGCTAMWDAIGSSIQRVNRLQEMEDEKDKPQKTLFIITTDGKENASTEYTKKQVRNLIMRRKKAGWEFIFLGANIETEDVAEDIGIGKDYGLSYEFSRRGIRDNFRLMNKAMCCMRKEHKDYFDEADSLKDILKKRKRTRKSNEGGK